MRGDGKAGHRRAGRNDDRARHGRCRRIVTGERKWRVGNRRAAEDHGTGRRFACVHASRTERDPDEEGSQQGEPRLEGVVLVLRHRHASREEAQAAIQRLWYVRANLLGVVVNGVDGPATRRRGVYPTEPAPDADDDDERDDA